MRIFNILKSNNALPPETISIEKKKKAKKYLIITIIAAVLLLAGYTGVTVFLNGSFFKKTSSQQASSIKYAYTTGASYGPVAVLGLCPLEPDSAELLCENVIFTKSRDTSSNCQYAVQMDYNINITENTTFSLPFAHTNENNDPVEIYVDGVLVNCKVDTHPVAYVTRPEAGRGMQQSVNISPDYENFETQPNNTYELMMDAYKTGQTTQNIKLDTKFKVYDISNAKEANDFINPSFKATGDISQLRLLFVDGFCEVKGYKMNYVDGTMKIGESEYCINESGNTDKAKKKWLAVLDSSSGLNVQVDGDTVDFKTMTLNEILSQNLLIAEKLQSDYLYNLSQFLTGANPCGETCVIDSKLNNYNIMSAHSEDTVDMFNFEIDEPGEHLITIKIRALGGSNTYENYMLQWIDSPSVMWSKISDRKLLINISDKKYDYNITDEVFNFSLKKDN